MRPTARVNGTAVVAKPTARHQAKPRDREPRFSPSVAQVKRPNTRPAGKPSRGSFPFGAPPCRIYRPAPSVMQAGGHKRRTWVLEFEPVGSRWIEPLMGWTATDDPFAQIRLAFPTLSAAAGYAERQGNDCRVIEPRAKRFLRKSGREAIPGAAFRNRPVGQAAPDAAPYEVSARR
ncbi:MAG TPA: ETC complex I subunit [Hyphomicrobiaceae bacterium]|nr:ETC complex I subunit [Hyphomicrobiaceae bacterium]